MKSPRIDTYSLLVLVARNCGMPAHWFKTRQEYQKTLNRSAAAKKAWATRKAIQRELANPPPKEFA